ncbi:ankyrin repeat domain-containing protein [Moraxella cuniculi]|nr:ankyrin repeat domain-containing protein [Moraxella cuniculi]
MMSYNPEAEEQGVYILSAFKDGMIDDALYLINKYSDNHSIWYTSKSTKWNWLHKILLSPSSNNYKASLSVKYLIDLGLDINAQDIYGMTPLHYALRSGNAEAAIELLNAGADPNIPNIDNLRPLSMAAYTKERSLEVLELMLEKGGNVHNIINENETILQSWTPQENSEQWEIDIYNMMKKYS